MKPFFRYLVSIEPLLVLLAGPFLIGREWEVLPDWTEVAALAWLGLLWLARRVALGRWTVPMPIDVPVLALLLTLPGAIWAAWDGHRPAAFSRAESLIFAIAIAYAVANWITTRERAWRAGLGILLTGLALGVAGLLTVDWIIKYPALAPVIERLPQATSTVPHATLRTPAHPNQLGGLVAMTLPMAIAVLFWWRVPRTASRSQSRTQAGRRRRRRRARTVVTQPIAVRQAAGVALIFLLPLLLLTQSRGAWVALLLVVGSMILLAWYVRLHVGRRQDATARWGPLVLSSLVLLGLLLAIAPVMFWAVRSEELPPPPAIDQPADRQALRFTAISRLYLWQDSLRRVEAKPVTGIGLHNFVWRQANRDENEGLLIYPGFSHSHNLLLQSALDYGLPGVVAVAGMGAALFWAGYGAHQRLGGTSLEPLLVGAWGGLGVWGLHGVVDAVAIGSKVGFLPWALVGLLTGLRTHAHLMRETEEPDESTAPTDRETDVLSHGAVSS